MQILKTRLVKFIFSLATIFIVAGCSNVDEPSSGGTKERLILIYAVAANNLEYNFKLDMQEVLNVAPSLNLRNNKVLVYYVLNAGDCYLKELSLNKENGKYELAQVCQFAETPLSTSEDRIREVIDYVVANYQYPKKGLILWSHSDAWIPWFQGSTPSFIKKKSFGWDNYEGNTYKTNITTLAEAIPEDVFDFIWFDCCYMANIETIYQLRSKTPYIIGSVMEVEGNGMPYHITLPYLLRYDADLTGAANAFFEYYNSGVGNPGRKAVSVSVTSAAGLKKLADISGYIIENCGVPEDLSGVQTYQRNMSVKLYDMKQLLQSYNAISDDLIIELDAALNNAVVFKEISDYDFHYPPQPINVKDYSGLSMHNFINDGSSYNEFYKTLDWYKDTRNKEPEEKQ